MTASLPTILQHWALVTLILLGLRLCYGIVQLANETDEESLAHCREQARVARCREAADRLEALAADLRRVHEYPVGFVIGSLANPVITKHDGRAYFVTLDDIAPVVVEVDA